MNYILWMLFSIFLSVPSSANFNFTRPSGFKFGVATAAYQIEGGWNVDGKGENIWDRFTHTSKKIKDGTNGDVACDSYHLWRKDVELLEYLGVDFYRFSLSWTRILPNGFHNKINKPGIAYYNNLIDLLISKGIEPMVTLYHWDLPQPIQDLGGWINPKTADYFAEYARLAFALFGNRVKTWITINEPASICVAPYEYNDGAPGIISPGIGSYLCGKTVLIAHAKAYRIYQAEFAHSQQGKVGITIDSGWAEPRHGNMDDQDAADREMQMSFGWFVHPIFSATGDYPLVMSHRISTISLMQNFTESRLPAFSDDEKKLLKGSADFLGLNHYHTWMVSNKQYPLNQVSFDADKSIRKETNSSWPDKEILPWGLIKLLTWIKTEYNNPLVYITENGIGDTTGNISDTKRIQFLEEYINATVYAAKVEGCNVAKYTVWSLMDNMEWTSGYTIKFGLYQVDFKNPAKTRNPKTSAAFFKGLIMK
ncbi:myrosinase 1-like [Euwallacea similis]|uniref:myrosinase 1-like n=1 Tax=Euwallacea similis TaxID=1736056 RepID=UPI00344DC153